MKIFSIFIIIVAFANQSFAQKFSYNMMTSMYSLHNKKGKTICADCYIDVKPFKDGKAWVKDTTGSYHSRENTDRGFDDYPRYEYAQWGLIDKNGKWIIKPQYNKLDSFINGVSLVGQFHYKYFWAKDSNNYTIAVDSFKGIEKDSIYKYIREYEYTVRWGTITEKGKEIIPVIYPELYRYIDGYALAALGVYPKKDDSNPFQSRSYKNNSKDTTAKYVLVDIKGNIYKRLYHYGISPQYIATTSEPFINSYDFSPLQINYINNPPFYSYMDIKDTAEYYGLLNSKGDELIPPNTYTNKSEMIVMMLIDPNDPYTYTETSVVSYKRPPFCYDSISRQLLFKFATGKFNSSIIANDKGDILYKSNDKDFLNSFPSNNYRYINFVRTNGDYKINFSCPVSEKYDTVTQFFNQFKSFNNMEITAFEQQSVDSPYNNVTHKLYITNRDTLYGLINKNFKEIIPLKYAIQRENTDDNYIYNLHFEYSVPTISFINETKQYIYSGMDIFSHHFETFIISSDGDIVKQIENCEMAAWDAKSSAYILTFANGFTKLCDTKGNIK